MGHKVELGYLEQTAVSGSDRTVWQEVRSRMTQINLAEAAIESAAAAMTAGKLPSLTPRPSLNLSASIWNHFLKGNWRAMVEMKAATKCAK